MLPPNLGVISSFFNKEVVSTSPSFFFKYANFSSWIEALPKYLISAHLWRYTGEPLLAFGIYHVENNTRSQCASLCHGTPGSLKASHNSDYQNISWSNPTPDQKFQKPTYEATLLSYKHHKLQYTLLLQC